MIRGPADTPGNEHNEPSIDMDARWETVKRRHRMFAIGWLILVLAIAGAAWYVYPQLKRHEAALGQFTNVQRAVDTMGGQLRDADSKLQTWAGDRQELHDQMTKLGQRMEVIGKQARESAATLRDAEDRMEARIQARVDSRMQKVETSLSHLASSNDNQQTRLAEMQNDLAQARREAAKQSDEIASLRRQIEQNGQDHERQLATLREREESDQRDVKNITHKLDIRRVDFEVTKNHSQELAPGISLDVTGTDAKYGRVNGWMQLASGERKIWLRGQAAQEPVVFYGDTDGRKRELIITSVARNSITGYLLVPGDETGEGRQSE